MVIGSTIQEFGKCGKLFSENSVTDLILRVFHKYPRIKVYTPKEANALMISAGYADENIWVEGDFYIVAMEIDAPHGVYFDFAFTLQYNDDHWFFSNHLPPGPVFRDIEFKVVLRQLFEHFEEKYRELYIKPKAVTAGSLIKCTTDEGKVGMGYVYEGNEPKDSVLIVGLSLESGGTINTCISKIDIIEVIH